MTSIEKQRDVALSVAAAAIAKSIITRAACTAIASGQYMQGEEMKICADALQAEPLDNDAMRAALAVINGDQKPAADPGELQTRTVSALQEARRLIDEAMTTHIYDECNGEIPPSDCHYVVMLAELDALILEHHGITAPQESTT